MQVPVAKKVSVTEWVIDSHAICIQLPNLPRVRNITELRLLRTFHMPSNLNLIPRFVVNSLFGSSM